MLRFLAGVLVGTALTGAIVGTCCASRCAARMCRQANTGGDNNKLATAKTESSP